MKRKYWHYLVFIGTIARTLVSRAEPGLNQFKLRNWGAARVEATDAMLDACSLRISVARNRVRGDYGAIAVTEGRLRTPFLRAQPDHPWQRRPRQAGEAVLRPAGRAIRRTPQSLPAAARSEGFLARQRSEFSPVAQADCG